MEMDPEQLKQIVQEAVRAELKNGACGMMEVYRQLGRGDLREGMAIASDALWWAQRTKKRGERVGWAFVLGAIAVTTGGTVTALWYGVKALLFRE